MLKRGRGPAELTDAGQPLYEIIGHTLRALDEFRGTCARQPVEIVVGAGESLIQWLLLPRTQGLAEAHPRLAVTFQNLKTDEILRSLLDGGVDFGVVNRFEPTTCDNPQFRPIEIGVINRIRTGTNAFTGRDAAVTS